MKKIIFLIVLAFSFLGNYSVYAQDVKVLEGVIPDFSKNRTVNILFFYEKIRIGSFDNEQEYMERNIAEFNKKEAGRGDQWAENWSNDKKGKYEPAFTASLSENGFIIDDNAPYTIIFRTLFIEPGFHAGPVKRSAFINAEADIVSSSDKSEVLARISIKEARGKASIGSGYDEGGRISKCYGSAAKALAKFLKKN